MNGADNPKLTFPYGETMETLTYKCQCGSQAFREEQAGWQCQVVTLDPDGEVTSRGELYFADDGSAEIVCADCGAVQ